MSALLRLRAHACVFLMCVWVLCVVMYLPACLSMCVYVFVCVCVCVCLIRGWGFVRVCLRVHEHARVRLHVRALVRLHAHACVRLMCVSVVWSCLYLRV